MTPMANEEKKAARKKAKVAEPSQKTASKPDMDSVSKLVEQTSSSDQPKAYQALQELRKQVWQAGAPGNTDAQSKLAGALAEALTASLGALAAGAKGSGGRPDDGARAVAAARCRQVCDLLSLV